MRIAYLVLTLLLGALSPARASQIGIASSYGYTGHKTASNETFNTNAYTAAHRTLPFGTIVLVMCLKTKKKVKVRINDRGPFVKGRIIDLAPTAASACGITHKMGITEVALNIISIPEHRRYR